MKQSGSNKKVKNSLVIMSSAAVLAVYAAGYARTWSAAARFDAQSAERRPAGPGPPRTAPPIAEIRPAAPSAPVSAPPAAAPAPSNPAHDAAGQPSLIASAEPAPITSIVPGNVIEPSPVETPAPLLPAAPVVSPMAAPVVAPVAAPPAAPVAKQVAAPAAPAPPPAAPGWKDGTYYGWGSSRHGNIQAAVVIEGGRIASATIAQCWTRYPCSVIARIPPEVAQRQSPEVDYVSRATDSVNAFYWAVVEALNKAK